MGTYPPPGPGFSGFGRRLDEALELIELELHHAISYVNDAVVPQVRRESISAMRRAADTLRTLVDRLDAAGSRTGNPAPGEPANQPKDPRP